MEKVVLPSTNNEMILSIVVPVYNVEEYLEECVDSIIASIEGINAEVLLIDDGSTDSSSDIAKSYAAQNEKIKYYRKPNGGLSDARNYGAARATGKYLAFADSDDLVSKTMYHNMIEAAEFHQADLTIINVMRVNSKIKWESSLHQRVFNNLDKTVTHIKECDNLIYDTTSWNKLIKRSFWVEKGFQYPVGWRYEDMPVSLAMHYEANKAAIVHEIGYLWRIRDRDSISITQDTTTITNLEHRLAMLEAMFEYIDTKARSDERITSLLKSKILSLDIPIYIDQIETISESLAKDYRNVIVKFFDEHFTQDDLALQPIIIQQKYKHLFENNYALLKRTIKYGRTLHDQSPYIETESEICVDLPDDLFNVEQRSIKNEFLHFIPSLHVRDINCSSSEMDLTGCLFIPRINTPSVEDINIQVMLMDSLTGEFIHLNTKRVQDKSLTKQEGFTFRASDFKTGNYNYDGAGFSVHIGQDIAEIICESGRRHIMLVKYEHPVCSGSVLLFNDDTATFDYSDKLTFGRDNQFVQIQHDESGTLILVPSENSNLSLIDSRFYVDTVQCDDACLMLTVNSTLKEALEHCELVYFDDIQGKYISLAEPTINGEALHFAVDFSKIDINKNLYSAKHHLQVRYGDGKNIFYSDIASERHKKASTIIDNLYLDFFCGKDGCFTMYSCNGWTDENISESRRRYNRWTYYPEFRKLPLDENCILFEAYWGSKYQCNPKAFYEYMDQFHPEYKCIWSLEDDRTPINGNGIRVRKYSKEYYYYLATATYLINNVNFENEYRKRNGQIEIQTMHGTPFKSLGLDVPGDFKSQKKIDEYIKRNSRWNYLIVQGKFSEDMAWQWFRYDKAMLETGYPRTDKLFQTSEEASIKLKKQLGIPDGKTVIMYAPTYRRRGFYHMPLDLEKIKQELSDDYVLMIRLHHFALDSYTVPEDGRFIFDVGHYSNIEDLFAITDILITDYSSIMFDYALTGKPMVFHTYDLDDYDDLRGSYFDIRTEAPGAITTNDDELLTAIRAISSGELLNKDRVDRFKEKYLTFENDKSSEKIFNEVFAKEKQAAKQSFTARLMKKVLSKKSNN